MAGSEAAPFCVRRLGRGLARGRDRHRRLTSRRALSPTGRSHRRNRRALEGLGTLDSVVRSPRRARCVLERSSSGSAAIGLLPVCRSRRIRSSRSPKLSLLRRKGCSDRKISSLRPSSTRFYRVARSSRSSSAKSYVPSRRSVWPIPMSRCSRRAASSASSRPSATGSIFASASIETAATPAAQSPSDRAPSSTATGATGRYDVAFRLQENHWNGTVSPQLVVRRVFDADDRFDEVYTWLRAQWQAERREAQAQAIFDELEVEAGGPKRHPLESETFRALLERAGAAPRRLIIRPETAADLDAIREVNDEAFGEPIEAKLVDAIRASDRFVAELSLVAVAEGRPSVMSSRATSTGARRAPRPAGRAARGSPFAPASRHRHRSDEGDDQDRRRSRRAAAADRRETRSTTSASAFRRADAVGIEPPPEAHGPQYFMIRPLAAYDPAFRGRAIYPPETFGIVY